MDIMSLFNMLGNLGGGVMQGAGEEFNKQEEAKNNIPLLNPAFYGQKNASGSNAPLDNSLGKDARKVAGVSEGGATPQMRNNMFDSIGNSIVDWLKPYWRKLW